MTRSFDEINDLNYIHKAVDYEEYFGEMDLTEEQKEERISLAEKLEKNFLFVLALAYTLQEYERMEWVRIQLEFEKAYQDALSGAMVNNSELQAHIKRFAEEVTTSTRESADDPYMYTTDRAMFMAEDQSNTAWESQDYVDAVAEGLTFKEWVAIRDKKTRKAHAEADGQVVPIDEPFEVDGEYLMCPKDDSLGASAENIVNCRCTARYF